MSAPVSFIECVSKMAYTRVLSCVMLALISSIIASIQLNLAIIDTNRIYCILKFTSLKHRRKWWCASETIIMKNFHHPLLSLLSFTIQQATHSMCILGYYMWLIMYGH